MKTLRSVLISFFLLSPFSLLLAKDIAFATPVDASHYIAGAGEVVTVRLLSIDYEAGTYRFQLLDAEGHAVGNGAVCGVQSATPSEDTAAEEIRAAVAATNS